MAPREYGGYGPDGNGGGGGGGPGYPEGGGAGGGSPGPARHRDGEPRWSYHLQPEPWPDYFRDLPRRLAPFLIGVAIGLAVGWLL